MSNPKYYHYRVNFEGFPVGISVPSKVAHSELKAYLEQKIRWYVEYTVGCGLWDTAKGDRFLELVSMSKLNVS